MTSRGPFQHKNFFDFLIDILIYALYLINYIFYYIYIMYKLYILLYIEILINIKYILIRCYAILCIVF